MKKRTRKIAASAILITIMSFNAFADGDMQCPKTGAPCLADRSGTETKSPANIDTKGSENLSLLIVKMLKAIGFPF